MTRARRRTVLALALVAAHVAAAGCRSGGTAEVATLVEVLAGAVEWARGDGGLTPARVGQSFRTGDAVRTSASGGARLRLTSGGGLALGPATTIRFGKGSALTVDGELAAENADAVLELAVGTAELSAGTRVRVGGARGIFEVLLGRAVVIREGDRLELQAGDSLEVELGRAQVRRRDRVVAADAGPTATNARATPEAIASAEIVATVRGRVKARAADEPDLSPLAGGRQPVRPGTRLELGRGARVALERGDQRATIEGPAALIVGASGGALFDTDAGKSDISASGSDVAVTVPGGQIVVKRGPGDGSRAALRVSGGSTHVEAVLGDVEILGPAGRELLALGESALVDRKGGITISGRPPKRAVFEIDAGVSATIHDPAPPTDLGIRFAGACPGPGVIDLLDGKLRRRIRGDGSAIVQLARDSFKYQLRCVVDGRLATAPAAEGRLRVVKDSGTRPLPPRAPTNTVDADGRRYTVLYQSLLPALRFRWPGAPAAERYTLEIKPDRGKPIVVSDRAPLIALAAGRLGEGSFTFRFSTATATSKSSELSIGFDNAAASGYLSSPRPELTWGARVRVAGGAVDGWTVMLDGQSLALDGQLRFATEVAAPAESAGLAVGFSHPTRGLHFYVRRSNR